MKQHALALMLLSAIASPSTAHAASPAAPETTAAAPDKSPVAQETEACKQQEQQQGASAPASAVKCVVKVIFQSRIRRRKDEEAVEMTAGSPPLQTDDSETPGAGNLEINLGLQGTTAGGEHRIELPVFDVNYGVGDALQLSYMIPYVFLKDSTTDAGGNSATVRAHGVGDSSLGLKYRFYDNNDTGISFAIAPEVEFRTPGANRKLAEGTTTLLPLIMTREFEHASFTANAGVKFASGSQRYFGSFGVGRRLNDNVALLAEIAGNDLNATDEKRVLFNVGLRRKMSGSQSISGALGRDVMAGGDQRKLVYFTLAYQKIFGK